MIRRQRRRRSAWRRRLVRVQRVAAVLGAGMALYAAALALTSPARSQAHSPACTATGGGSTVRVGATRSHTTLAAGVAAANAGDTICIDPGDYPDSNGVTIDKSLRILGVGGRPRLIGVGDLSNQKGLIITRADIEVNNLEFVDASVSASDGANGAGIRHETGTLVVRNSSFRDNQNGILTNSNIPDMALEIEGSSFYNNGSGAGDTHGVYMTGGASATLRDNYFESTNNGHDLKSLAAQTTVIGNTFEDSNDPAGQNPSFSIDAERGGVVVVEDNTFIQRSTATNRTIINYGGRSGGDHSVGSLDITSNTVINERSNGSLLQNNSQTGVDANVSGNRIAGISSENVIVGSAGQDDPPMAANNFGPFTAPVLQNNGIIAVTTGTADRSVVEYSTSGAVQTTVPQPDGIAGNSGITALGGDIYIANNEQGIARLDGIGNSAQPTGTSTFYFGGAGIEALTTDGTDLFAGLFEAGDILHFDTDGTLLNTILLDQDMAITGLAWFDNLFFVANHADGNVYTFDMFGNSVGDPLFASGLGAELLSALAYDVGTDINSTVDDSIWLDLGYAVNGSETRRYSLDGQLLDSFASSGVRGLVAAGSTASVVSEPETLLLLGSMLLLLAGIRHRRRIPL